MIEFFANLNAVKVGQFCVFFFSPTCVLRVGSSLATVRLASVFLAKSFVLYFNTLVCAKGFGVAY